MKKLFYLLIAISIASCKSIKPSDINPNIEKDSAKEITDVSEKISFELDSILKVTKGEIQIEQKGYFQVCANVKGWQKITEFRNQSNFFMDGSQAGYWYSDNKKFDIVGIKHRDGRHPFPYKNAMALIVAVQTVSSGQVNYYEFTRDEFGNLNDIWIGVSNGLIRVYGMVNDWQARGLGDNRGCLKVYAGYW
ncbi:hypothetical protein [Winogradskyella sp. R77965]|uniref:hypothetical protein n=1 Tax=Winogradskyella sp. R77965 TaxID=3093872 RepID=UPI0037DD1A10